MKVSASGYGLPTNYSGITIAPGVAGIGVTPTLISITPNHAYETEETEVTIAGTGFTGTTRVLVHEDPTAGNVRDLVVVNDEEITCKVPPRYGTAAMLANVYVETPGGVVSLLDAWTYHAGSPPGLVSITGDIGDTLGGDTIVLHGSGFTFTQASDVLFGSTPAASIVVDSDIQITVVTPAHVAGLVDVSVSGSTLSNAFEFWSPASLNPSVFYEANFVVSGGTATWTPRSTTLSGGLATRAAASGPTAVSGYPQFNVTNKLDMLGQTWSGVLGTTGHTYLAILEVDLITSSDLLLYRGDAIVAGAGQWQGLFLGGANKDLASVFMWAPAEKYASVDLGTQPITGRVVLAAKWDTTLRITKDGSTWVTGDTPSGPAGGQSTQPVIGADVSGFKGRIKTLIMDDVAWSDANVAKFYRWAAVRHP